MERPLVSVGMPVFNCAKTVGAAIQSIVNQTYENWELILINDGSTDSTDSVCRLFADSRIRYICDGENKGLHHRLNEAIDLSCGKYLARMDGDDVSFPERLERQVDYLENHPEVDLLGTPVLLIDGRNRAIGVRGHGMDHDQIQRSPWWPFPLAHPTWMGKLPWFRKYRYGASAVRIEDQEILLRAYKDSRFAVLGVPQLAYRAIDLSSARASRSRRFYSSILVRQFIRRGHPMFLIASLIYGLLSFDAVYRLLQRSKIRRNTLVETPPKALLDSWARICSRIEASIPH